jgi:Protein of unknown function (DUF2958)
MKLLTADIRNRLIRNGHLRQQRQLEDKPEPDFWPVVKLFTPDAGCTWLLTEIDPEDPDIAFGLCDLGMGCPELGPVSLSELQQQRPILDGQGQSALNDAGSRSVRPSSCPIKSP